MQGPFNGNLKVKEDAFSSFFMRSICITSNMGIILISVRKKYQFEDLV